MPDMQEVKSYIDRDTTRAGAAGVFVIASFLPYVSASGGSGLEHISVSIDAWHSFAILGLLLVFAAAGAYFARLSGNLRLPDPQRRWDLAIPGAAAVGLVLLVLRAITEGGGGGISVGPTWGFVILLIAGLVLTAGLWLAGND